MENESNHVDVYDTRNDEKKVANLIPEGATADLSRMIQFARRFRREEEHDEVAKRIRVLGM